MSTDFLTDLLLVVPHPDDEVFGSAGILARTAAAGRTATLTLTRGAAGRTLGLCTRSELADKREKELRASLAVLGVQDVTILDHQDYVPDADRGLAEHPGLAGLDFAELLAEVLAVLNRTRPRALLTFPPNGSNGHPDHCLTHRLAVGAFNAADVKPERLYYFASARRFEGPQRPGFLSESEMHGRYLAPTHAALVGGELEPKLAAMGCHETQALSVLGFMRNSPGRLLEETFHRAHPPVAAGAEVEHVSFL